MASLENVWQRAEQNSQLIADAANDLIVPLPIVEPEKRWLWLTLPNCGFAVEVLRQQFEKEGLAGHAVVNRKVAGKRFEQHTLLAVEGEEETIYIDPTYLQLFSEFGLDANVVAGSWETKEADILPTEKTIVYTESTLETLTEWLAAQTIRHLYKYRNSKMWHAVRSDECPQPLPSYEYLREFFTGIYNPLNYEPYFQKPEKQQPITEYLEEYKPGRISLDALFRHYSHRLNK